MKCLRGLGVLLLVAATFLGLASLGRSQPTESAKAVSPQVGADRKVTFRLLAQNAKDVKVVGDFSPDRDLQMVKDDKGVWSYTTAALEPGIYGYYFKLDGQRIVDPSNLFTSSGAKLLKSYVEVAPEGGGFWAIKDVPHGALHEHYYKSSTLGTRHVLVYTPPGYNPQETKTYPALYLYHGSGDNETYWTRVGRANFIADNVYAEGKAKPALLVMPFGHSSVPPGPEEGANGKDLYEVSVIQRDLLECVIPLIEKEYRVGKEAKDRAITGMTMGGYQAVTIGLNNTATFGYVVPLSSNIRPDQDLDDNFKALLADTKSAKKNLKLVWMAMGERDNNNAANKRLSEFLTKNDIPNELIVTPGGTHTWLMWRGHLRELLPMLFRD